MSFTTTLLLATIAFGHMFMTSPSPTFADAFQYDKRSPSMSCGLVSYSPGLATLVLTEFNSGLNQAGFSNLKSFVDACGKFCGNTISSASVPFPQDNTVRIDIGVDHIGPSEIWVDDRLVMSNPGIDGGDNIVKTPSSTYVDFAKECSSGNCLVRFVMAALHNSPAEIYDSCVRITGPGTGGSNTNTDSGTWNEPPVPPSNTNTESNTWNEPPASPPDTNTNTESNNADTNSGSQNTDTWNEPPAPPSTESTNSGSWNEGPLSSPPLSVPASVPNDQIDTPSTPTEEPAKVIITSYPKAKPTPESNTIDPYAKEWSCGGDAMLVRSVNGMRYEIACPAGTKCKTEGWPYAMCT